MCPCTHTRVCVFSSIKERLINSSTSSVRGTFCRLNEHTHNIGFNVTAQLFLHCYILQPTSSHKELETISLFKKKKKKTCSEIINYKYRRLVPGTREQKYVNHNTSLVTEHCILFELSGSQRK